MTQKILQLKKLMDFSIEAKRNEIMKPVATHTKYAAFTEYENHNIAITISQHIAITMSSSCADPMLGLNILQG